MSERSQKVTQLLDLFKTFTVLEVKELVDAFEEDFGVTAAAPAVAMGAFPGAGAAGAAEAEPEQTSFDVILKSGGPKKIQVIKEIRAIVSGLGLKEAKDLVDGAPKPIKEGVSKEEAEQIKQKVEAAGGEVEIK